MSTIFILAALGVTFFYTNPAYRDSSGASEIAQKSVKELIEDRVRYGAALQKTREIEEVRNGLLTRYNSITGEQRDKLEKILPSNIDSVRLIIDVNNIAARYNMSMRKIDVMDAPIAISRKDSQTATVAPNTYSYVTLSFSLTGTYQNLMSFITDLEKSLRVSDIVSLIIKTIESTGAPTSSRSSFNEARYEMTVAIRTYFLADR